VAQIDAAFEHEVLDIPERQEEAHVHEDDKPDDLR
jgi:hypothetical protein